MNSKSKLNGDNAKAKVSLPVPVQPTTGANAKKAKVSLPVPVQPKAGENAKTKVSAPVQPTIGDNAKEAKVSIPVPDESKSDAKAKAKVSLPIPVQPKAEAKAKAKVSLPVPDQQKSDAKAKAKVSLPIPVQPKADAKGKDKVSLPVPLEPKADAKAKVSLRVPPHGLQPKAVAQTDPKTSSASSDKPTTSTDLATNAPKVTTTKITSPHVTMNLPPDKIDMAKAKVKKPKKITSDTISITSKPLSEHSTSDVLREFISTGKETQKKALSSSQRLATSGVGDISGSLSLLINKEDNYEGILESRSYRDSQENMKLLTEDASIEEQKEEEGKCFSCWKRTRGIIFAIVSSLLFSLTSYFAFVLNKERDYSMPILVMTRFTGTFFFSSIIMPWFMHHHAQVISTVCPMSNCERRSAVLRMFLRAFVGSLAVVCQFYSLMYIPLADSTVIMFCNPVFVALGARIFLKEKLTICASVTALLAILGVIIISKPPFLVGKNDYESEQLLGLGYAFASMLLVTATTLLMRSLRDLHFSLLNSVFGLTGMVTGLALALATATLVRHAKMETLDFVMLFALGTFGFGGVTFNTLALTYELAGPVSVARSSEVIFSFLWQMISNIFPDSSSLAGAALVLICILLTGFYQFVGGLDPSHKIRRWFWFVLK